MKYLSQLFVLITITFIGELLAKFIPLPIPGPIYGLVILFLLLQFKVVRLDQVEDTGNFLISMLSVMFIVTGAGLLSSWNLIASNLITYIVMLFVSTILVMGVTGFIAEKMYRGNDSKGEEK